MIVFLISILSFLNTVPKGPLNSDNVRPSLDSGLVFFSNDKSLFKA